MGLVPNSGISLLYVIENSQEQVQLLSNGDLKTASGLVIPAGQVKFAHQAKFSDAQKVWYRRFQETLAASGKRKDPLVVYYEKLTTRS